MAKEATKKAPPTEGVDVYLHTQSFNAASIGRGFVAHRKDGQWVEGSVSNKKSHKPLPLKEVVVDWEAL